MKEKLIIPIIAVLLFSTVSTAQRNPLGKYTFTVQPLQLLLQEVSGNIERTVKRNSFGLMLAYRFQTNWDENTKGPYYNYNRKRSSTPYSISDYQSYTVGLNFKHYLKSKLFLEAQLFYRHWWDDNEYNVNTAGVTKVYVRDVTHIYGAKFMIGRTYILSSKGLIRPILNTYAGLSVRYRENGNYENSISKPGAIYYYRHNTIPGEEGKMLGLQLGVALGVSFYPKTVSPE